MAKARPPRHSGKIGDLLKKCTTRKTVNFRFLFSLLKIRAKKVYIKQMGKKIKVYNLFIIVNELIFLIKIGKKAHSIGKKTHLIGKKIR